MRLAAILRAADRRVNRSLRETIRFARQNGRVPRRSAGGGRMPACLQHQPVDEEEAADKKLSCSLASSAMLADSVRTLWPQPNTRREAGKRLHR
jgi:hypothetical protein